MPPSCQGGCQIFRIEQYRGSQLILEEPGNNRPTFEELGDWPPVSGVTYFLLPIVYAFYWGEYAFSIRYGTRCFLKQAQMAFKTISQKCKSLLLLFHHFLVMNTDRASVMSRPWFI